MSLIHKVSRQAWRAWAAASVFSPESRDGTLEMNSEEWKFVGALGHWIWLTPYLFVQWMWLGGPGWDSLEEWSAPAWFILSCAAALTSLSSLIYISKILYRNFGILGSIKFLLLVALPLVGIVVLWAVGRVLKRDAEKHRGGEWLDRLGWSEAATAARQRFKQTAPDTPEGVRVREAEERRLRLIEELVLNGTSESLRRLHYLLKFGPILYRADHQLRSVASRETEPSLGLGWMDETWDELRILEELVKESRAASLARPGLKSEIQEIDAD